MAWTYEGYWKAIFGHRNVRQVVAEFDLDGRNRVALDEWLSQAEVDAVLQEGIDLNCIFGWDDFHARALTELLGLVRKPERV